MSKPLLPIVVVAGFLGAGKTTFMRHLLREAAARGTKVGVIINEWGVADIDGSILGETGVEMFGQLAGGCACCSSLDEMIMTMLEIGCLPREEQPDVVVMELSGLADPLTTLDGLTVAALLPIVRVASMISLVDATRMDGMRGENEELSPLLVRQAALADLVIVNKSDLAFRGASAEDKQDVFDEVRATNPKGRIEFAKGGQVDLSSVWERIENATVAYQAPNAGAAAHRHTQTISIPIRKPLSRAVLERELDALPAGVWRAKGFVRLQDEEGIFLVQHVGLNGSRWSIEKFEGLRPGALPPTDMVFIGSDLNQSLLWQRFAGVQPLLLS